MNTSILLTAVLATAMIPMAGCNGSRTSDYPDNSVNTTRKVDDLKQNARDQKDAVDADADRVSTKMDFDERQIRAKYKAKRQDFINASEKDATGRDAKTREIQIQAKHDKDVIDAELASKLNTTAAEKHAEIQADAASRKSEIDSKMISDSAPMIRDAEKSKAEATRRGLDIDQDESKEISALEQERSKARNTVHDRKLKIDTWLNDELAKVEKSSTAAGK